MRSNQENLQTEILKLLDKIDQLTTSNSNLQEELDEARLLNEKIGEELRHLKQNQMKASKQRTRILRERDEIVRDISCELDTMSANLNSKIKEKSQFEMKYKDKVAEVEVLEAQLREIKSDLKNKDKIISNQRQELNQYEEMKEIYEQMKLEMKAEVWKKKLTNKKINAQIQQIHKNYFEMNNQLNKSQQELKSKLKESFIVSSSFEKKNCSCHKQKIDIENSRMKLYKTENIFLKKKVIKLLNRYCSSVTKPSSKSVYKKLQNKFELSFNQKINLPSHHNIKSQKTIQENTENKISSIINASFVEQSNVIGGKTFHFVAKKTASYQELENQEKTISGKI